MKWLVAALLLIPSVAFADLELKILGPTQTEPGNLTGLKVETNADIVIWNMFSNGEPIPTIWEGGKYWQVGDDDVKATFASGKPGKYLFNVIGVKVINAEERKFERVIVSHILTVGKPEPVKPDPVDPKPVEPDPQPTDFSDVTAKVKEIFADLPPDEKSGLADVYSNAAKNIKVFADFNSMKTSMQQGYLDVLGPERYGLIRDERMELNILLSSLITDGRLVKDDVLSHKPVWLAVAEGLK